MQSRRQFIGTIAAAPIASVLAAEAIASQGDKPKSLCSQVKPARLSARFKVRYPSGGSEWVDVGAPVFKHENGESFFHFRMPICTRAMTFVSAVLIDLDENKWLWRYHGEPLFLVSGDQAFVDMEIDI